MHVVYLVSDGLVALLKPASPPSFSVHTGERRLALLEKQIQRGICKRITSQVNRSNVVNASTDYIKEG